MLAGSLLWMLPLYGHSGGSSLNLPTFVGAVSVDQPEVDAEQTALTARERALPSLSSMLDFTEQQLPVTAWALNGSSFVNYN